MLRLLGLPEADLKLVTKDRNAARIHVSFMGKVFLPEALRERIAGTQWTHVVAFRPTGDYPIQPCWTQTACTARSIVFMFAGVVGRHG